MKSQGISFQTKSGHPVDINAIENSVDSYQLASEEAS